MRPPSGLARVGRGSPRMAMSWRITSPTANQDGVIMENKFPSSGWTCGNTPKPPGNTRIAAPITSPPGGMLVNWTEAESRFNRGHSTR